MRDRSWGTRKERGYRPVGYTWLADASQSLLVFAKPAPDGEDEIYSGYVRRGDTVSYIVSGRRSVRCDPVHGWVTGMDLEAVDERGSRISARASAVSRMLLPHSTSLCVATLLEWDVAGARVYGEDQDVWPMREWRMLTRRR